MVFFRILTISTIFQDVSGNILNLVSDLTLYLQFIFYLLFFLLQVLYAKINGKPWKIILPQNFRKAIKIYSSMLCNLNLFELWLFFVFIWLGQIIMLNGVLDKSWTLYKKSWSNINFWSVIQNRTFFLKVFIHSQPESLG